MEKRQSVYLRVVIISPELQHLERERKKRKMIIKFEFFTPETFTVD